LSKEPLDALRDAVVAFDAAHIGGLAESALNNGVSAFDAVMKGMAEGMKIVGIKYQQGEFFLADLLLAADTFREGMNVLGPCLKSSEKSPSGRVVIGTVEGDLHDIGKNLVKYMLEAAGFGVDDLGVDVSPEQFVRRMQDTSAEIVAVSALLSTTLPHMSDVVDAVRKSGAKAKIIVGGAPMSMESAKSVGADGYGRDAVEGATICKQWAT
jgi:5-methyltetrahydrofolate--homocysteine methyltransferase